MDYALRISFLWLHKGYPQTVDWITFIISQYLSAKYLNWLCCEPLGQLRFSHGSEFLMRLQFPKYQLGLESLVTSNLSCGKICIQTYSQGHCQTACNHWLTTHISFLPSGPSYEATCNMAAGFLTARALRKREQGMMPKMQARVSVI